MSAPQLLPAFRQLTLTDRTDVSYEFLSAGFRPAELAGLFLSPLAGGDTLYHGLTTLALVGLALTLRRQPALARFWAVVAAVALIDSLGGSTFMQGFPKPCNTAVQVPATRAGNHIRRDRTGNSRRPRGGLPIDETGGAEDLGRSSVRATWNCRRLPSRSAWQRSCRPREAG